MITIEEQIVERYNLEKTIQNKEYWLNEVNKVLTNLFRDLEELKGEQE